MWTAKTEPKFTFSPTLPSTRSMRMVSPGDFLGNRGFRSRFSSRCLDELPDFIGAIEIPDAAAFTRNREPQQGAGFRGNVSIGERQSPQEAIENGIVELAGHDARLVHSETNLLLVMPVLRELARGVKPVWGFFFASPAYAVGSHRVRVARGVIFRQ